MTVFHVSFGLAWVPCQASGVERRSRKIWRLQVWHLQIQYVPYRVLP